MSKVVYLNGDRARLAHKKCAQDYSDAIGVGIVRKEQCGNPHCAFSPLYQGPPKGPEERREAFDSLEDG